MIFLIQAKAISVVVDEATMRPKLFFTSDILDDMFLFEISEKFDKQIIKQKVFHFCPNVRISTHNILYLKIYKFIKIGNISGYLFILIDDADIENMKLIRSYKLKTISEW
jgi:hypothetical protein